MPPFEETDEPPEWDQEEAGWLLGKYVIVGVTRLRADGATLIGQAQYHGKIITVDKKKGVEIECAGKWLGQHIWLPPHLSAFDPADKGEYRLRSTGEVVNDPDVVSSWTVKEPPKA
ncbi:MAG TPA: hypothetical protein VGM57_06710 [Pseudolabrys sp.]